MAEFVLVPKELAPGVIAGTDYGRQVRIMARSPSWVLFNALGCQVWNRNEHSGWHGQKTIFRGRPTMAKYEEVAGRLDELFGIGAAGQVLAAWSQKKTLLVDGGGAPLPLPNYVRAEQAHAAYAAVTINRDVPLTGRIPTCKQCGKDLKPKVALHYLGHDIQPDHPRSIEDCQRMTNYPVVAIFDYGINHPGKAGFVQRFETWDGAAVWDPHFCDDKCAAKYGRRAASQLPPLEVGVEPRPEDVRTFTITDTTHHYGQKEREGVILPGGTIRL